MDVEELQERIDYWDKMRRSRGEWITHGLDYKLLEAARLVANPNIEAAARAIETMALSDGHHSWDYLMQTATLAVAAALAPGEDTMPAVKNQMWPDEHPENL